MVDQAAHNGMALTIGNGVSTGLGNLGEALIIQARPDSFAPGLECNGFAKLANPLLCPDLVLNHGQLEWANPEGQRFLNNSLQRLSKIGLIAEYQI